jgi:PAS domain S-box-containing protein
VKSLEADLLKAMEQAVIATDLDGKVVYWNRFAEKLYGWTMDEVLGRHILDVTPTADSRASAAEILAQLEKGESWAGEFMVRHKDGRWFPVHVTDSPVCDENGVLVAIVGVSVARGAEGDTERAKAGILDRIRQRANDGLSAIAAQAERTVGTAGGGLVLTSQRRAWLRSFAVALLIYAAAVAARFLLNEIVPERLPFITFFPAVLLAAFFCGLWPAVAVLLAAAVTGLWWADPPTGDVLWFRIWSFLLFIVVGGANLALVVWLLNILARLRRQDAQLALINRELKHRLKNLFAVTSSICLQTIKSGRPAEDVARAVSGRIQAVASAQDLLSITALEGSDLRSLVDAVVRPVAPDASRLQIEGPAVTLPAEVTTPFALILHELATNAVKHGAWKAKNGQVSVGWRMGADRELEFTWRERGGPAPAPAVREGLGSTLIKRGLNNANVDHAIASDGLDCRIRLPL